MLASPGNNIKLMQSISNADLNEEETKNAVPSFKPHLQNIEII
jgi:hypothetical protein